MSSNPNYNVERSQKMIWYDFPFLIWMGLQLRMRIVPNDPHGIVWYYPDLPPDWQVESLRCLIDYRRNKTLQSLPLEALENNVAWVSLRCAWECSCCVFKQLSRFNGLLHNASPPLKMIAAVTCCTCRCCHNEIQEPGGPSKSSTVWQMCKKCTKCSGASKPFRPHRRAAGRWTMATLGALNAILWSRWKIGWPAYRWERMSLNGCQWPLVTWMCSTLPLFFVWTWFCSMKFLWLLIHVVIESYMFFKEMSCS